MGTIFNNLKSQEFFDPQKLKRPVHVIGCGAVGGSVAELLVRLGVPRLKLWDMDKVAPHNLGNQVYRHSDVGSPKTLALSKILTEINPEVELELLGEIKPTTRIQGYVFLCVDNIDLRRELCQAWKRNPNVLFVTDGRMRLTDGVIYAADWNDEKQRDLIIASMQYSHEEAAKETPVSACGLTLSVVCTPRMMTSLMVANWIKFINTNGSNFKRFIQLDSYEAFTESYRA